MYVLIIYGKGSITVYFMAILEGTLASDKTVIKKEDISLLL